MIVYFVNIIKPAGPTWTPWGRVNLTCQFFVEIHIFYLKFYINKPLGHFSLVDWLRAFLFCLSISIYQATKYAYINKSARFCWNVLVLQPAAMLWLCNQWLPVGGNH